METQYNIIRRSVVTEKSMALIELAGCYTFRVNLKSSKKEIKTAIENIFQVHVKQVRTLIMPGKVKRAGKAYKKTTEWKKAFVTLAPGEKINLYGKEGN